MPAEGKIGSATRQRLEEDEQREIDDTCVVEKKEQSERTELRVAATQEQEAARWP